MQGPDFLGSPAYREAAIQHWNPGRNRVNRDAGYNGAAKTETARDCIPGLSMNQSEFQRVVEAKASGPA